MDDTSFIMNVQAPIISFLLCAALGTNVGFLMALKADKTRLSNSDRVQCVKTFLILFAILLYIPMETWILQYGHHTFILCLVKDIFQSLFMDSYPVAILVVAIIRFRLTVCSGNTTGLVSRRFVITVSISSALLVILIATGKTIGHIATDRYTAYNGSIDRTQFCFDICGVDYLKIGGILLTYVVPMIITTVLYALLVHISTASINRIEFIRNVTLSAHHPMPSDSILNFRPSVVSEILSSNILPTVSSTIIPGFATPMNTLSISPRRQTSILDQQTRGTKIIQSVTTLIVVFGITTIPIVVLELADSSSCSKFLPTLALVYLKVFLCLLHPIGEGLFHKEKRNRCRIFLERYMSNSLPSQIGQHLSRENAQRTPMFHTNLQLSTLVEEDPDVNISNSCKINSFFTNDDVFTNDELSTLDPSEEKKTTTSKELCTNSNAVLQKTASESNFLSCNSQSRHKPMKSLDSDRNNVYAEKENIRATPRNALRCQNSTFLSSNIPYISPRRKRSFTRLTQMSPTNRMVRLGQNIDDSFRFESLAVPLADVRSIHNRATEERACSVISLTDDETINPYSPKDVLESNIKKITGLCDTL